MPKLLNKPPDSSSTLSIHAVTSAISRSILTFLLIQLEFVYLFYTLIPSATFFLEKEVRELTSPLFSYNGNCTHLRGARPELQLKKVPAYTKGRQFIILKLLKFENNNSRPDIKRPLKENELTVLMENMVSLIC